MPILRAILDLSSQKNMPWLVENVCEEILRLVFGWSTELSGLSHLLRPCVPATCKKLPPLSESQMKSEFFLLKRALRRSPLEGIPVSTSIRKAPSTDITVLVRDDCSDTSTF